MVRKLGETGSKACSVGDYVLATKWSDGDPNDQWAVGFLQEIETRSSGDVRYHITDNAGKQFRGNGFRRVAKISKECGDYLVSNAKAIDASSKSLWSWKATHQSSFC